MQSTSISSFVQHTYLNLKNNFYSYITFQVEDKLLFRTPIEYKRNLKDLRKRITILKRIKAHFIQQRKIYPESKEQFKTAKLSLRIHELQCRLIYLQNNHRADTILKCSLPFNFLVPGSGKLFQIMGYGFKVVNGLHFRPQELPKVIAGFSIAKTTSFMTTFAFDQLSSLKTFFSPGFIRTFF